MRDKLSDIDFLNFIDSEIFIHPLKQTDSSRLFNEVCLNYDYLLPWCSWITQLNTLRTTHFFINDYVKQMREDRYFRIGIYTTKGLIGWISAFNFNHQLKAYELGYWIAQNYTRHGYVFRVCQFLINLMIELYGLRKIFILCHKDNLPSRYLALKLGGIEQNNFNNIYYYKIAH